MEKVSDFIWRWLYEQGIDNVYFVAGGAASHLVDSLRNSKMKYTACLHEQQAALAAVGHAHMYGTPAVCLTTSGPGATNAITGCLAAWMDFMPVIFISGQVKTEDSLAFNDFSDVRSLGSQEADIISMVTPITKKAIYMGSLDEVEFNLSLGYHHCVAAEERQGPIWFDVPVNIQGKYFEPQVKKEFVSYGSVGLLTDNISQSHVRYVLRKLKEAKRPVIMVGWGLAQSGDGMGALNRLLELLPTVPFMTTWKAMEAIPDYVPNFAGRPGTIGQRAANLILQSCDLLIAIGCRLDQDSIAFNPGHFAPYAEKIIIDISAGELKKHKFTNSGIRCDARVFVEALNYFLEKAKLPDWMKWHMFCRDLRAYMHHEETPSTPGFVNPYEFMRTLSKLCVEDEFVVLGSSGPCANNACQEWEVKEGQRFVFEPNIGAMGIGLPEAVSISLDVKPTRVILINGDGGFQVNMQMLQLVKEHQPNLKIFIYSNRGYASIAAMQRRNFGRLTGADESSGLYLPEVIDIAHFYDLEYSYINSVPSLKKQLEKILCTRTPIIVEVPIAPDQDQYFRSISEIKEGEYIPGTLENLWPYLPASEIAGIIERALEIN